MSNSPLDGSVPLWHAWKDSKRFRELSFKKENDIFNIENAFISDISCFDTILQEISQHERILFCNDIFDVKEFKYLYEMLLYEKSLPFVSRTGRISGIKIRKKNHFGYIIPSSVWLWNKYPNKIFLENMHIIYALTGFQAPSPASLSEKILRSTLPEKLFISKPSIPLRNDILENNTGGRIDKAKRGFFYPFAYEYDKNKAYLSHAKSVPSPFGAPLRCVIPSLNQILQYPVSWCHCHLIARNTVISPIQVDGRSPTEGEKIDKWLWTGEILDCLEAGYTLEHIEYAYAWRELSDFMVKWCDKLAELFEKSNQYHPHVKDILKSMSVGLPGRFLKRPENYKIIPVEDAKPGDLPITLNWQSSDDTIFSDFVIRTEYDKNNVSLCYIGSYIIAEMRRELYQKMLSELKRGNNVLRSYIDSFTTEKPSSLILSQEIGGWKEKRYQNVFAEENRMIGRQDNAIIAKLPGFENQRRNEYLQKYFEENY